MLKHCAKICLIIGIFLLSGCGFTLRTVKSLPPPLQQIYYQTDNPYGQFEVAFKRALKASKTILLTAPDKTLPILVVTSNYNYNTTSSISSVQARIYTLNYTATVSINDFFNKTLLAPQTVGVTRNVTLQPNEIFESSSQVVIVKQEMARELSDKVLNILRSKQTVQVLEKNNENSIATIRATT
jgi:outer membrane lipopolysaccharide assembly protein LptE/RlpB